MKKLRGFSLMEMMIVLLIVAIIAAASAPMINKKLVKTAAGSSSPWVWTSLINNSIAYNLKGNNDSVATIGATDAPRTLKTRLYISSTNTQFPQISLGMDGNKGLHIKANDSSLLITDRANAYAENTVTIGRDALSSKGGVIIGDSAQTASDATDVVAVGLGSRASSDSSTAVGHAANAVSANSIAIGHSASVAQDSSESIAIGRASASGTNSTVIGAGASSTSGNTTSVGERAQAVGDFATAIGSDARALTRASVALGRSSRADGGLGAAVALGTQSEALAFGAHATGWHAIARAGRTVALGYFTEARRTATGSIAIGSNATTEGQQSIAIGSQASAANTNTIAIGNHTQVTNGEEGIAIGNTTNVGSGSVAIGSQATALGRFATAIGAGANASNNSSTAIGVGAFTRDANQIVLGAPNQTVYIPGHLVVGRNVILNNDLGSAYTAVRPVNYYNNGINYGLRVIAGMSQSGVDLFRMSTASIPSTPNGSLSDRRLKNVGKPFVGGLEQIKKLEVFNYTFKQDKTKTPQVGVMAQDLQKVFPNSVFKGDDGFFRIKMDEMFYAIINAIKELDTKVTYLMDREKKINELQHQVNTLEKRLTALEKKVK